MHYWQQQTQASCLGKPWQHLISSCKLYIMAFTFLYRCRQRLSERFIACKVLKPLLSALAYVHGHNIVHRYAVCTLACHRDDPTPQHAVGTISGSFACATAWQLLFCVFFTHHLRTVCMLQKVLLQSIDPDQEHVCCLRTPSSMLHRHICSSRPANDTTSHVPCSSACFLHHKQQLGMC